MYSWAIDQNPLFVRIGILVEIKATTIIISSGIAAKRVSNPINNKMPQMISNVPVK